jgi:hypothetical protein|tara:strand:- start:1007 stop:1378 length:372 start_codon:yes stop_codon:yes gene_type:complete
MNLIRQAKAVVLVGAMFFTPTPSLADKDLWFIHPEWAECLIANLAEYQDAPNDPVVVVLQSCPEASTNLSDLVKNSGSQAPTSEGTIAPDPAVVFSKQDLKCLSPDVFAAADSLISVPKSPCR